MPAISIILPTYNRAKLLPRAIDSILKQSFTDWELVIWDDGSTDDSDEIIRAYREERIKYHWERNHGVAYARNQAIQRARGKYLAFIDSDDEWKVEKLSIQVDIMESSPGIDVLFTNFVNVNLSNESENLAFEQNLSALKMLVIEKINDNLSVVRGKLLESLASDNYIIPSSVIMRRELIERIGFFNEKLQGPEDFELWWRMGLAGVCFAYLGKEYVIRYKPPGSLSSPGKSASENYLKALDFCSQASKIAGRVELLPYLMNLYRNTWQNMILIYAGMGEGERMLNAFFKSIQYGFRLGAVRLLIEGAWRLLKPLSGTKG